MRFKQPWQGLYLPSLSHSLTASPAQQIPRLLTKPKDIGELQRLHGVRDLDNPFGFAVIDYSGGEDGLFVLGNGAVHAGDETGQGRERSHNHPRAEAGLGGFPFRDQRGEFHWKAGVTEHTRLGRRRMRLASG